MVGKEKMENYLKTILKIQNTYGSVRGIDISRELDVSKPTVSVAVHELEKDGYVNCISSSNIILRTCPHRDSCTSFRQILPVTALKILEGRQPVGGFLPCH